MPTVTRLLAVVLVVLVGTTACSTFSKPKPPPTMTVEKAAVTQLLIRLDQVFLQLHAVVEGDCAAIKARRSAVFPLVAADCATLYEIKTLWTSAINDTLLRVAAASEGQAVDVEKLTEFLMKLALLAAKLAVLV